MKRRIAILIALIFLFVGVVSAREPRDKGVRKRLPARYQKYIKPVPETHKEHYTEGEIDTFLVLATPPGSIVAWPTATPPTSWLECDGSAVSRTTYADLFGVISDDYGNGDGSTTFNLPDYRGEFLRGFDNGAGTDPDAGSRTNRGDGVTGDNVGTKQADELERHRHIISQTASRDGTGGNQDKTGATGARVSSYTGGSTETRPTNVGVMWIIKY